MKIVLVSPPNIHFRSQGEAHLVEPLGIAYIGAVLERDGHEVKILDADTLRYSVQDSVDYIIKEAPDITGFSCLTPLAPIALRIAAMVKERIKTITVFGGVHPTTYPKMTLNPCVDFLISGEGEFSLSRLLTVLGKQEDWTDIPGIYYKENGKLLSTGAALRINHLDDLPFPARHLLPMDKYRYSFPILSEKGGTYASINCSRGCPYKCIFCSSPAQWKNQVRYRSAENIVEELKHLKEYYGVNTFYIRDEVFSLNKRNVLQVCEKMVSESLRMNWFCYVRADHVDKEIMEAMRAAGCLLVKIGVESGDAEILKKIKKGETLEQMKKAFKIAERAGLYTHASFMIGHPWDSRKTIRKTIQFAKELNADTTVFPISTPFPGTELWHIVKDHDLLLTEDFEKYGYVGTSVVKTMYLDANDLVRLEKQALREFYFRPAYIMKALKRIFQKPGSWKMYLAPLKTLLEWIFGRQS